MRGCFRGSDTAPPLLTIPCEDNFDLSLCRCERNASPPGIISPPSIDLHGVSVSFSVACKDDSLYHTKLRKVDLLYPRGLLILPHRLGFRTLIVIFYTNKTTIIFIARLHLAATALLNIQFVSVTCYFSFQCHVPIYAKCSQVAVRNCRG